MTNQKIKGSNVYFRRSGGAGGGGANTVHVFQSDTNVTTSIDPTNNVEGWGEVGTNGGEYTQLTTSRKPTLVAGTPPLLDCSLDSMQGNATMGNLLQNANYIAAFVVMEGAPATSQYLFAFYYDGIVFDDGFAVQGVATGNFNVRFRTGASRQVASTQLISIGPGTPANRHVYVFAIECPDGQVGGAVDSGVLSYGAHSLENPYYPDATTPFIFAAGQSSSTTAADFIHMEFHAGPNKPDYVSIVNALKAQYSIA